MRKKSPQSALKIPRRKLDSDLSLVIEHADHGIAIGFSIVPSSFYVLYCQCKGILLTTLLLTPVESATGSDNRGYDTFSKVDMIPLSKR